ncbi:hypothetical protein MNBD_PLANCTO02-1492 [hydrothermal vent metagenome]|uniref:Uncharacterized protein n=1 Tax=hydrothermal vent metagenome TaxID=652676 RepID=A0A3B1DMJ1_9ZZZZ
MPTSSSQPDSSPPEKNKLKSLWGVMEDSEVPLPEKELTEKKNDHKETSGKGLWDIIESASSVEQNLVEQKEEEVTLSSITSQAQPATPLLDTPSPQRVPGSYEEILLRAEEESKLTLQVQQIMQRHSRKSWYSMGSFIAGTGASLLSLLSLLPEIYWKLPASLGGMIAIILGLLAFDELRRKTFERSQIILPALGLLLGIIAMFAGPLIFIPWGEKERAQEVLKTETKQTKSFE